MCGKHEVILQILLAAHGICAALTRSATMAPGLTPASHFLYPYHGRHAAIINGTDFQPDLSGVSRREKCQMALASYWSNNRGCIGFCFFQRDRAIWAIQKI